MKHRLEEAIEQYLSTLLEKHAIRLVDEKAYGLGAFKNYESDDLFIRIVNDKGIITFYIAPKGQPDKARDIALYKELLDPPAQGYWNLSIQEQAEYLESNMNWLITNLSGNNIDFILKKVNDCARNRCVLMFGASKKYLDHEHRN